MEDKYVKSVLKTIEIIEELSNYPEGLTLNELSKNLCIHKSSVFRVIDTLSYKGYVEKNPENHKYKLGIKIVELSGNILRNMPIREIATPFLKKLSNKYNEVVHLTILRDGKMVYIDKIEKPDSIAMFSQIGRKVNVYSTAVGKAMLAFLENEELKTILEKVEFEPLTPNTITNKEILLEELKLIRKNGFAFDQEENENGIKAVAAPIFNQFGRPVAALSVTGPTFRMSQERMIEIKDGVLEISQEISKKIGFNSNL